MSASTVTGALITALATIVAAFIGPRIGLVVAQPTVTITADAPRTATPPASHGGGGGTQTFPGKQLFQQNRVQLAQGYQLSIYTHHT